MPEVSPRPNECQEPKAWGCRFIHPPETSGLAGDPKGSLSFLGFLALVQIESTFCFSPSILVQVPTSERSRHFGCKCLLGKNEPSRSGGLQGASWVVYAQIFSCLACLLAESCHRKGLTWNVPRRTGSFGRFDSASGRKALDRFRGLMSCRWACLILEFSLGWGRTSEGQFCPNVRSLQERIFKQRHRDREEPELFCVPSLSSAVVTPKSGFKVFNSCSPQQSPQEMVK